jgi:protoporphyrin/coproporphyrin ferrochelatase
LVDADTHGDIALLEHDLSEQDGPMNATYDALILVSFGGPRGQHEVEPFLANVTSGRAIPPERLAQVARQYEMFAGASPINAQCELLLDHLGKELRGAAIHLPIYWGNRNWHPMLADTVTQMTADGVRRALAIVTSPYGSYSSCRQYLDDIERARAAVGPNAPVIDKIRHYFNHPGFIDTMIANTSAALEQTTSDARLVFTAHSIPESMAAGAPYVAQLREVAALVGAGVGHSNWDVVFQSRSGSPEQRWLAPDVNEHLRVLATDRVRSVVLVPIGFVSDHMEVVYDLDTVALATAAEVGIFAVRAATVGVAPRFVTALRELVSERIQGAPRRHLGSLGPAPDRCRAGCCPAPGSTGPAADR